MTRTTGTLTDQTTQANAHRGQFMLESTSSGRAPPTFEWKCSRFSAGRMFVADSSAVFSDQQTAHSSAIM